jgi:hypothetical protein
MAKIENYLNEWNVFVDGRGYAGKAKSVTVPKLNQQFTEFKAAGMNAPVDVPMPRHEKLEAQLVLNSFDIKTLELFGVAPGATVAFKVYGSLVSRNDDVHSTESILITMRGYIKSYDMGSWEAGGETSLNLGMTLVKYTLEHNGKAVIHSEPENMKLEINGKDVLADVRGNLGL